MSMRNRLNIAERNRMEKLLQEAKNRKEDYVANIIRLALTMDDKGEYDKFIEVFSEPK